MIHPIVYLIIIVWAGWCILSRKVNDGILGRIFYAAIAFAAFAAYVGEHQYTFNKSNVVLITAVSLIGVRHFVMKMWKSHYVHRNH